MHDGSVQYRSKEKKTQHEAGGKNTPPEKTSAAAQARGGVSHEIERRGGPLTLQPLLDRNPHHLSQPIVHARAIIVAGNPTQTSQTQPVYE